VEGRRRNPGRKLPPPYRRRKKSIPRSGEDTEKEWLKVMLQKSAVYEEIWTKERPRVEEIAHLKKSDAGKASNGQEKQE